MTCSWCAKKLIGVRSDSRFCSRKCRQAAWRARVYSSAGSGKSAVAKDASLLEPGVTVMPLRFCYADPPYPGTAKKYYGSQSNFEGEVDHRSLIDRLMSSGYAGWALSTSARALRQILPLCPPEIRVCAWVKPGGAPPATRGLHNVWEALIVLQGRRLRPGRRDAIYIHPARFGGELPGRKPLKFCAWLFGAMGMLPGDQLDDLFPGSGIVSRAWAEISGRRVAEDLERIRTTAQDQAQRRLDLRPRATENRERMCGP
jgi:hypothetical protein